MNQNTTDNNTVGANEISIGEVALKLKAGIRHLKNKWLTILITGIICAVIGVAYSFTKKPVNTANCTFVLDEVSQSSGLGQYAGLAALAGIDFSGSSSSGLYQGDNIIELYKSRLMIEKALLTEDEFNNKKELLIDRYIDFNKLREKWRLKNKISNITFTGDASKFSRTQDSIINDLVNTFNKKVLTVTRPDKKLSIINVEVSSEDELFAKEFTNVLVLTANNFYVEAKTKKTSQNVQLLQKQADSIRLVLNSSISGVASALDASPNANPLLQSLKVPSQKRQIDVQASSAIYGEVVKNLEVSKMLLRQETPLIQIIDGPVLPLIKKKLSAAKGGVIGLLTGILICSLWLIIKSLF